MTAQELAEKILSWIQRTRSQLVEDSKPLPVTRESVLIDDIEKLCKEQRGR